MASLPSSPTTPRTPSTPRTPGTPSFNTKSPTIKRILQESRELASTPDPSLHAAPLETNLFEWHFTIGGPPSTPYEDGIYHGRIILPPTYPLRPPSFRFLTPSGRFEVNREICLSISGHHEESWQPAWGIRTALCAIRAFMAGEAKGQVGGLDMSESGRLRLARESRAWRCQGGCGGRTNEEVLRECEEEWKAGEGAEGPRKEDEVPEELRLEYRDDLERGPPTPRAVPGPSGEKAGGSGASVPKSPLVAGPVANLLARSKPPPSPLRATSSSSSSPSPLATSSTPHPGSNTGSHLRPTTAAFQSPVPPTPTVIPPTPLPGSAPLMTPRTPHAVTSQEAIPWWVDKAIVGLIIGLAVMLLKKIAA